ncbi:MAG: aryl-sulfate sulfotransferase [Acidobacteria bacterium]|nr:aryl-sulfate sulfotransferase [Acidobacteriota bacterium]
MFSPKLNSFAAKISFLAFLFSACASAQALLWNDPRATDGYRLISRLNSNTSRLIDREGTTVHEWKSDYLLASVAVLQEDGTLLRNCLMPDNTNFIKSAGGSGHIEVLDWEGRPVWTFELNTDFEIPHHDVQRMPNGNYLILSWNRVPPAEAASRLGVDPNAMGGRGVLFERILEVRPNYPSGGEIVWEWNVADHIVQDRNPDWPNYGELYSHPQLVNVHFNALATSPDWFHANAIDYNAQLDQIVISVRNYSEVWVIDHSTTSAEAAGHSGGRSGKGGDLLYRWGNPYAWAGGYDYDTKLGSQHNAQWIRPGLPGAGDILVFVNNEYNRPTESAVVEFTPPIDENGAYPMNTEDGTWGPKGYSWFYSSPIEGEFFSDFISGAQRLPNGNTFICSGAQGNIFEVNPEGEVLWKFAERGENEAPVVWLFRSGFYAPDYSGLIGTPLYQAPPPPTEPAPEPESAAKAVKR